MAVATAWGLRVTRRGSAGVPNIYKTTPDNKDRLALDINLLKQQYEKLRERQRQAHIILTAACARQTQGSSQAGPSPLPVNQLLMGRSAILSNKGRRIGAPQGAIPPVRKTPSKSKNPLKQAKRGETLHWKDTDLGTKRRNSLKWKDIPPIDKLGDKQVSDIEYEELENPEPRSRKRSESSSYSEDSDANSSTSTSLCDDENLSLTRDSGSSLEASPFRKKVTPVFQVPEEEDKLIDIQNYIDNLETESKYEIISLENLIRDDSRKAIKPSSSKDQSLTVRIDDDNSLNVPITSTSQLSPIGDISQYLTVSSISPLKTPSTPLEFSNFLTDLSPSPSHDPTSVLEQKSSVKDEFTISEEGVINVLFERINSTEPNRPTKLDLPVYEKKPLQSRPLSEIFSSSLDFNLNSNIKSTELKTDTNLSDVYKDKEELSKIEVMSQDEFASLFNSRDRILKGKSASLDEPKRNCLERSQPISCPEGSDNRNSDRALKIIQENSKILHRILKKNNVLDEETTVEEILSPLKLNSVETLDTIDFKHVDKLSPIETVNKIDFRHSISPVPTILEEEKPKSNTSPTISDTLSSIENTIKSINSLCQERETYEVRSRRNRLMNNVEEVLKAPSVVVKDCSDERDDLSCPKSESLRVSPLSSLSPSLRGSRDASRDPSPRRRQQEDKEEYENRVRRKTIHFDDEFQAKISPPASPVKIYSDHQPFRIASVTSTMYDRYLVQKSDSTTRIDKSPSSPVITRSYLESLKPVPSTRVTRSAENSPSRSPTRRDELKSSYHGETFYSSSKSDKYDSLKLSPPATTERRSFDSIPYQFKADSGQDSESVQSPFRPKPHQPSDICVKLGLYKSN